MTYLLRCPDLYNSQKGEMAVYLYFRRAAVGRIRNLEANNASLGQIKRELRRLRRIDDAHYRRKARVR